MIASKVLVVLKYFQILEKFISMSAMTSIAISLAFMVTWHFHRNPKTTIGPKITITHIRERETLLSINQHYKKVGWLELNN